MNAFGQKAYLSFILLQIELMQVLQIGLREALGKPAVRHEREQLVLQVKRMGLPQETLQIFITKSYSRDTNYLMAVVHQVET